MELVAPLVFVSAVAVGGEVAFSEDEFEDWLQGGYARSDDYDVGFDAGAVSLAWYGRRSWMGRRGVLGPEDEVGGAVCKLPMSVNRRLAHWGGKRASNVQV
jgi:hypothetical protein